MPQIPTIQTSSSLLGRTAMLPSAGAESFGGQMGQAVERVGQIAGQAVSVGANVIAQKRQLESDKFTNDAMTQLRDYYSPWMADPENNSKESFADDFKKQADKSLSDWEAKAPNKEAKEQFRAQFQHFASSRYEAAANTAARTKLDNMLLSHDDLNGSVERNYLSDRNIPNLDANQEAIGNIQNRFQSIDAGLGKLAPEKAKQLKSQLVENMAYATMNYSPSTARKILAMGSGMLDGRRVHAIESQIKTAEDASKLADRSTLGRMVEAKRTGAQFGIKQEYLDIKTASLYLPDAQAQSYVTQVNAEIKAYNQSIDDVDRAKSWNPQAKLQFLSDLRDSVGKNKDAIIEDALAYKETHQRLMAQIKEAQDDPGGALIKYNPAANGLAKQVSELIELDKGAKTPNPLIKQKQGELSTLLLTLQTTPPDDYSDDQKKQHWVVNRSDLMVMSKTQAEANVDAINKSSPEEAVGVIRSVVNNHPNHEDIAFNNLVQNGLDLAYWALYKNQNNQNIADLSGSLKAMKELKETNPQRLSEINDALNPGANQRWDAFLQLFPNDNYQRQDITAGMRRAVVAYASALMQDDKMSPELAVAKSVDTWLYSEMAMTTVNGQPVLLDRQVGDQRLDDDAAHEFGRSLGELQKRVNPREIDDLKYHFPSIWGPNGLGTEEEKWNQTQSVIASRGFFKPAGEYSTLYMRSDTGRPFELRRNGKAIAVKNTDAVPMAEMITWQDEYGVSYSRQQTILPGGGKPIFEKANVPTETTGLSARDKGFTGMANLFNPASPHNLLNRIYGDGGLGATGKTYVKQTTPQIISTNWPVEPKFFQDRK